MAKAIKKTVLAEKKIIQKIILLLDEKVILDIHLAELYGVETRVLKQAVRRIMNRFPKDFMFRLNKKEVTSVVSQFVIPHKFFLRGAIPFAFTETGAAMVSSVLKSDTAIEMNIAIVRAFIALRKLAISYKEIMQILKDMRSKYDGQFTELYNALQQLIHPPNPSRRKIGFKHYD